MGIRAEREKGTDSGALAGGFGSHLDLDAWFGRLLCATADESAALGRLGQFELLGVAGRGGQGLVYHALQRRPAREVALKRLAAGVFATQSMRARLEREIDAVAALDHPNIVKLYGVEEVDGQPLVAMQWIDGVPIDRWVESHAASSDPERERGNHAAHAIGEREILVIFADICDAIQHAHQRGVIHRDLKPSNILVDADGRPHVLDFGLAKRTDTPRDDDSDKAAAISLDGQFLGTLAWGSPEQAAGDPRQIDTRTDIYALGLVLYSLLTGQMPYLTQGDWREVLERIRVADPLPPRRALHGERTARIRINGELEAIVLKCLAKEPARRYQSAGELAADVQRLLAGEAV